ncbi:MAG: helix-turn-helix domain-containing protein [Dehalococcoidia bacterium]|nr:helix-turn-helix domain-containing protein [Dehalococcoidia bacterium]
MTTIEIKANMTKRKSGRPRAISDDLVPLVVSLYESGLGYRAIARELMKQSVSVDWSTVRRVIKKWFSEKDHHNDFYSNSNTILQRGLSKE